MLYLTGASNPGAISAAAQYLNLGLMLQPLSHYEQQMRHYQHVGIDNGCFSKGGQFDGWAFLKWIDRLSYRDRCRFVVAPDVFHPDADFDGMVKGETVSIAEKTLDRSQPYYSAIRARGYPVALVMQNGLQYLDIPWSNIDAVFVGGTTDWKLSLEACLIIREAKSQGKWAHMGRVNSALRLRKAADMGCDSADGTYLKYGPDTNLKNLKDWLQKNL